MVVKGKVLECLLVLCILLGGHTAFAASPDLATRAQSQRAQTFTPPKGKAIIYLYQRKGDGKGASPTIWLNNYKVGRLVPGSFTAFKLSPGRSTIRVDASRSVRLPLVAEAGKVYRVRLSVTRTAAGTRVRLTRQAHSDMASTRLLRNPRALSPAASRSTVAKKRARTRSARKSRQDASVKQGKKGVMLKTGVVNFSEDRQRFLASDRRFDDSESGLWGIEVYSQSDTGFALGGEILRYTAAFSTVGFNDRHEVDVYIGFANAKKYFGVGSKLQPFIGAGVGLAVSDIRSPTLSGNTYGLGYQLMTGIEYRNNRFGVFGEVKYIGMDTTSENDEGLDFSGTGFFTGIAIHF